MAEESTEGHIMLSMPEARRAELDAALSQLRERRPFDSMGEIVADAVVAAAAALGSEPQEEGDTGGPLPDPQPYVSPRSSTT